MFRITGVAMRRLPGVSGRRAGHCVFRGGVLSVLEAKGSRQVVGAGRRFLCE